MGQHNSHQCHCRPNEYDYTPRCNLPDTHIYYTQCSGYSECDCDMVLKTIIPGTTCDPCQQRRMLVNQSPPGSDVAIKCIRC